MSSAERNTQSRTGDKFAYDLAAGQTIHKGTIVLIDAGYAKTGAAIATAFCAGVAANTVATADGEPVIAELGHRSMANGTGADELTRADIGNNCFVVDAITVGKTDGGSTRCIAGRVRNVEASGVWVEF